MQVAEVNIHRVLLIDDDPEEIMILQEAIYEAKSEIVVTQVYGFYERNIGAFESADLIFLDINMPCFDGFDWLRKIRSAGCNLPVIMYSTTNNEENINKAYELGAHLFLVKPGNYTGLRHSVQSIFSYNWQKPEEVKSRHCQNGKYYPFLYQ